MKKFYAMLAALLLGAAAVGFAACGEKANTGFSVYAPDGAPALALTYAMAQENDYDFHVVDANNIQGYVTGEDPEADFCILPVNLASKLLGSGEKYQMLGVVTNGNLYFLTTGDNPALTRENAAQTLIGKTMGVVQLPNVPGLTLKATLADLNVPYATIAAGAAGEADKLNLVPFTPDNVNPAAGCDYYLCPEPAASAKIKGTASSQNGFRAAGDLQSLYGEGGYPQAVMVAKKSIVESDKKAVTAMMKYLEKSESYLEETEPAALIALLEDKRTQGLTPSFNANNLTKEVVSHCSVRFTASKQCKTEVNAFLGKLIAVDATAAATVDDAFYFAG